MSVGAFSDGDWFEVRRLLELLDGKLEELLRTALLTNAQGVNVRFGTTTLTWAGAVATSNFPAVTHGLTAAPTIVNTFPMGYLSAGGKFAAVTPSTIGATTFVVQAITTDNTVPVNGTTCAIGWVVIG